MLLLASWSVVVPSARASVPALPREVSESSTNSARTIVTTRSHTTHRHHWRRTRARVVSQSSAPRASVTRSRSDSRGKVSPLPWSSRVRQRALARPVTDLSASIASIGPAIHPRTASLRTVSRVVSRLSTIPARIVRARPRVRGVRPSRARARVIIHPFPHVSPRASHARTTSTRRTVPSNASRSSFALSLAIFSFILPRGANVDRSIIRQTTARSACASGRCARASSVHLGRRLARVVRSRRAPREAPNASNGCTPRSRGSSASSSSRLRRRRWCARGDIAIGRWTRGMRWRCTRIAVGW